VCLAVRDTGIGLPESRLADIFDAFTQADTSTTRRYGGTGLGLAISKQLVQLMHGQITVASKAGRGSEFSFEVPLRLDDAPPEKPLADAGLGGRRALLADANAIDRRVLMGALIEWGLDVTEVEDVDDVLAKTADVKAFDIVIIDASLPDLGGFELAARLQENGYSARVPVLMVSSDAVRGDAKRCRELGLAGYFAKPVPHQELLATLHRALEAHGDGQARSEGGLLTRHEIRESGPHLSVLVVEDHPVNQKYLSILLQRLGHEATFCDNGELALSALTQGDYELVLMDIHMPVMDGLTATRAIRALPSPQSQIPIIALTADVLQEARDQAKLAGVNAFIAKPVKQEDLEPVMADVVARAKSAELQLVD
jgi:CheY-like chemotaxis protein